MNFCYKVKEALGKAQDSEQKKLEKKMVEYLEVLGIKK